MDDESGESIEDDELLISRLMMNAVWQKWGGHYAMTQLCPPTVRRDLSARQHCGFFRKYPYPTNRIEISPISWSVVRQFEHAFCSVHND